MCRNIKKLRKPVGVPTDAELQDAALQFVRKISGYRVPSARNEAAFSQAVKDVTKAARKLFDQVSNSAKDQQSGKEGVPLTTLSDQPA
jgi:hypothetical protein